MTGFYNEENDFFSIIAASLAFHIFVIAALLVVVWLKPAKETPPIIPFFEMVNVAPPPAPAPQKKVAEPAPKPAPEPVAEPLPEPKPEIKPEIKPELKPEPKPKPAPKQEVKSEQKPAPASVPEEPSPVVAEAPSMDMPMDLPSDIKRKEMEMPAVRTLGNVDMDSQLKEYLNRLFRLVYQNFNPPSGTEISKGTKSSVLFQITKNGEIIEVTLHSSSGNSIWDRLAIRAVQITKPPPLPPNYTAETLPLIFDFREK